MVSEVSRQLSNLSVRQTDLTEKFYQEAASGPSLIRRIFFRETTEKFLNRLEKECAQELELEAKEITALESQIDSLSYNDKMMLAEVKETQKQLQNPAFRHAMTRRHTAMQLIRKSEDAQKLEKLKLPEHELDSLVGKIERETDRFIEEAIWRASQREYEPKSQAAGAILEKIKVPRGCDFHPSSFFTRLFHKDVRKATDEVEQIAARLVLLETKSPKEALRELSKLQDELEKQETLILSRSFSTTQAEALGFVSRWQVKAEEMRIRFKAKEAKEEKIQEKILGDIKRILPEELKTKEFDQLVSELWSGIPEEDRQKETKLYGGDERIAKFKMVRRLLVYKLGAVDAKVSPSLARRAEETGYPASAIKAIEKIVKRNPVGTQAKEFDLQEHGVKVLVYRDDATHVIVQGDEAGRGANKTVSYADRYFAMKKPEEARQFVLLELTEATSSGTIHITEDEETVEESQFATTEIHEEREGQEEALSPDAKALRGSMQIEGSITVDEGEAEFDKEIEVAIELKTIPGIMTIHTVIELESGKKKVLQEAAGYKIPGGDTKVINLEALRELADGEMKHLKPFLNQCYLDVADTMVEMHAKGYIHRDLKDDNPSSVLRTLKTDVKFEVFGTTS